MKPTGDLNALSRLERQRQLLKRGRFFKVICGAGNEDADEVYKLTLVYSLANASAVDLSARKEIVLAAKRAVAEAAILAPRFGIERFEAPYLTVSVGMPGDPHVRKAKILAESCTGCNACIPVCPTDAIPKSLVILESRCIGCGACYVACQDDAIGYAHKELGLKEVLSECVAAGAENIELHASVPNHEATMVEWSLINTVLPRGYLSVCLDRSYLSNHELRKRIEMMLQISKGRMIVQADGVPMSGGKDDFNTTLQAVATADIVAKFGLDVHILLSGGTNSKTAALARSCGVPCAGVSIGTFARHLVLEQINNPSFPNEGLLEMAVDRARGLVDACINSHKEAPH